MSAKIALIRHHADRWETLWEMNARNADACAARRVR
jgi:hypothetical protein